MESLFNFITSLFWLAFYLGVIFGGVALWGYNKLRRYVEDVREAESNTSVVIAKKTQLVNDLTALVLRYHQDEQLVVLKVSSDNSIGSMTTSYNSAGAVLSTIGGLAQRYPDLKSNAQFGMLMDSISNCEREIQDWRLKFNATAKTYNIHRSSVPHTFYAGFLGFQPAQYLNFDSMGAAMGSSTAATLADDGERMREIMGLASSKALGAGKALAGQGRMLVEKTALKLQDARSNPGAAAGEPAEAVRSLGAGEQFSYLDSANSPQGPMSRVELDQLFQAGGITAETNVLRAGAKGWVRFGELEDNGPQ